MSPISIKAGGTCVAECDLNTGECIFTHKEENKVVMKTSWDKMKSGDWYFFCSSYYKNEKMELLAVEFDGVKMPIGGLGGFAEEKFESSWKSDNLKKLIDKGATHCFKHDQPIPANKNQKATIKCPGKTLDGQTCSNYWCGSS